MGRVIAHNVGAFFVAAMQRNNCDLRLEIKSTNRLVKAHPSFSCKMCSEQFPLYLVEQNAMQKGLGAIQNSSFATQYYHSVCTKYVQSEHFAMQKCWMKSFPDIC